MFTLALCIKVKQTLKILIMCMHFGWNCFQGLLYDLSDFLQRRKIELFLNDFKNKYASNLVLGNVISHTQF